MPQLTRIHHTRTALTHPAARATWRNSFALRPADAIFAPAIKVGIAATLVLVAGGLLGQEQLSGIAALGALTSAFGRYQPYKRLGVMLVIVAAAMLVATGVGALMGASGVPTGLEILALALIAGLAAPVFSAFRIMGPGVVILVFAASAGAGYAHTFDAIPRVLAALGLGVVVGWMVAMAPALIAPMGPARLAVARAIAAVTGLGTTKDMDDAGTRQGAALAAVRTARDSLALSATHPQRRSARSVQLRAQAAQLGLLLDEADAVLELLKAGNHAGATSALDGLAVHEAQLRTVFDARSVAAPDGVSEAAAQTGAAKPQGMLSAARTALLSPSSAHQGMRMAAASALAGWAAVGLGLDHPLWASMGAVAALQGLNYGMAVQRGIQRVVGNVAGAVVAVVLLSLPLGFWPSVAMVIVFQVLAEIVVLKNYILTTIAVTPMALIMTGLGGHLGPDAAFSRVADTLVGVVVGVLVAALTISLADRHHLGSNS
ncbi:FUSC family protein [Arthrobacter sp. LAPM80]|uniref:FUSC family protein n=1 Tax=Arthrobacter sp. LAPM80 TaxID=3141788 RepID=UPI00398A82CF